MFGAKTISVRSPRQSCIKQSLALGIAWDIIYKHDWEALAVWLDGFAEKNLRPFDELKDLRIIQTPWLKDIAVDSHKHCKFILTDRKRVEWWHEDPQKVRFISVRYLNAQGFQFIRRDAVGFGQAKDVDMINKTIEFTFDGLFARDVQ